MIVMELATWIELQQFLDDSKAGTELAGLSSIDERVLLWIATRQHKDKPVFVQDVIMHSQVASPATLHKSLATLVSAGLANSDIDPTDQRRRILTLTHKAEKLLTKLDRLAQTWASKKAS